MKLQLKNLLITALLSSFLIGCSSQKPNVDNVPEVDLFTQAEQELHNGNIKNSIATLEALDRAYPFGPYSQQVQFDLIYAYYKTEDFPLAIAVIDRFIKLNPTHPNIDWVIYMRGLSNMAQDENTIQGWFSIDRSDRDFAFAQAAFKDFNYLINSFPYSPYSLDATKRLVYLKNRLAKYQLSVAKYYTDRKAYVAVINRVTNMLSLFPDTDATKEALALMKEAYDNLGLTDESKKVSALIEANINNVSPQKEKSSFLGIF